MPRSCSSGLRSRPSTGPGSVRSNGFEVNSMKTKKPMLIQPMTPRMRASVARGSWRLNSTTAKVHSASISVHSSSDPSCPPHTPAMRKNTGSRELELAAT